MEEVVGMAGETSSTTSDASESSVVAPGLGSMADVGGVLLSMLFEDCGIVKAGGNRAGREREREKEGRRDVVK